LDPTQNKIIMTFRARLHRNQRTCTRPQEDFFINVYYKAWTLGVRLASNM